MAGLARLGESAVTLPGLVMDEGTGLEGSIEREGRDGGGAWRPRRVAWGVAVVFIAAVLGVVALRPPSWEDDSAPSPLRPDLSRNSRPPGSPPPPDSRPRPPCPSSAPPEVAAPSADSGAMPAEEAPPPAPALDLLAAEGEPRELHTYAGHTGDLRRVAVTPDGTRALSGSSDGSARLWDVATGALLIGLQMPGGGIVESVAIDPEGRPGAGRDQHGGVTLIDLERLLALPNGTNPLQEPGVARTLEGHAGVVNGAGVHRPTAETAISCGEDGSIRLWDVAIRRAAAAVRPARGGRRLVRGPVAGREPDPVVGPGPSGPGPPDRLGGRGDRAALAPGRGRIGGLRARRRRRPGGDGRARRPAEALGTSARAGCAGGSTRCRGGCWGWRCRRTGGSCSRRGSGPW